MPHSLTGRENGKSEMVGRTDWLKVTIAIADCWIGGGSPNYLGASYCLVVSLSSVLSMNSLDHDVDASTTSLCPIQM